MKAFNRLVIASFISFFKDKMSLFFTFAFPIVFMVLFGLVFGGDEQTTYKVGVIDQDRSQLSTGIANAFEAVPVFITSAGEFEFKLNEMKEGEIDALVVIPNGLGETVQSASSGEIRVYFDPANQSSQVIIALVKQVIEQTNRQLSQIPVLVGITTESTSVYSLKNIDYLIPGILAMAIMFLGLFGSLPLVEWREKQVLKRLGATPLTKLTIVSSQVFYRVILALFQTVLIIAVAYFAFDVNMVGNWLSLFGLVILGILTFVAIGYLAVARPRSVEGAIPIIQLVQFPMLFLSGIFFPIDTMPSFMRPVVEVMPLTYLGDALRQVMTGASPDHSLPLNIIVMFGWFIAASILSIRFFRWE